VAPASTTVGFAIAAPGIKADEASDVVFVSELPLGTTLKVYEVPFVNPPMLQVCAPTGAVSMLETTQVKLPGVDVTV
jgi:hypothetical protein